VAISGPQWNKSVHDSEVIRKTLRFVDARDTLASVVERDDGARLGRAARGLSSAAEELTSTLSTLALFAANDSQARWVRNTYEAVIRDSTAGIPGAAGASNASPGQFAAPPECPHDDDSDVVLAAFGIPADELHDDSGGFSDARLLAAYRLNQRPLQEACDQILGTVMRAPPTVGLAVSGARDIITSASPWLTVTAARDMRQTIIDAYVSDSDYATDVLAAAMADQDGEWTAFERLQESLRRATSAPTERQRALAALQGYRHLAEGHTRRWLRVLLQLNGMQDPPSTVGALGEPAIARLGLLGRHAAEALLAPARNAEAHDDVDYDDANGALRVGGHPLAMAELRRCFVTLDCLQRAWIVGKLGGLSDCAELAQRIAVRNQPPSQHRDLIAARERFGHAGQPLRALQRDGRTVRIELDALSPAASNPCFLALTQAAGILRDTDQFVVRLTTLGAPVMEIPTSVLRLNLEVLGAARPLFERGLPTSTFLPALTWIRLAVEPPEEAANFAAWCVYNDAHHAILDAEENPRDERRWLGTRFDVILAAASATLASLPGGERNDVLVKARRVVAGTAEVVIRPNSSMADALTIARIPRLRDKLGPPPIIMPTVNGDRMPNRVYPHPVS
jgi:hypothetical protein